SGNAEDYYWKGIAESLSQYAITDGAAKVYNKVTHAHESFNATAFEQSMRERFGDAADKLEEIMSQKWASNFTTVEGWFDWRRTGYPNIGGNVISGAQGAKIPVRYIYG